MKPFERGLEFYEAMGGDLMADVAAYGTMGGYVFITPDTLMFGKPVRRDGGMPDDQWGVASPDAWYVRFAVGLDAVSEFISRIPYPLPFVGWSRAHKDKAVRWFDYNRVLRRKEA